MTSINVHRVRLTLHLSANPAALRQHLPVTPEAVGEDLARQVEHYRHQHGLSYYPALDFFQDKPGALDPDLLEAAQNLAWFTGSAVEQEIQRRLHGVFSHVLPETRQCLAFLMPSVRPAQADALPRLARHYTPTAFRFTLLVSSLAKTGQDGDPLLSSRKRVAVHLRRAFEEFEITSAVSVD